MNLVEKICDMILLCNVENLPHYIQNFIQAILAQYPCFPTYSAVSILILQTKLSKIFVGTADYQNSLINLSLSIIFYSIAAINSEHYSGTEDGSVLRIVCQFLKTLNFSSKVCNIIWNSVKVMHIQQTAVLGSVFSLLLKCNLFGMEEIVVVDNILLELKMKFPQIINKKWWMELNYYVQLFKGPTAMLVKS
ncbi:uncharacterized protein LOC111638612 [Centruroides sculpturatus]|uniref:uncharacterized protein LOC111638612 n=1 Tax=Centruroides sculpturatus TaxID=218467 RepID=UPI000C6EFC3A|nr:uncharacterized protein LOC111638612 [Centruroides sculpturatus]